MLPRSSIAEQLINILKRDDIKKEFARLLLPVIDHGFREFSIYIYIVAVFILMIFLMLISILVILGTIIYDIDVFKRKPNALSN